MSRIWSGCCASSKPREGLLPTPVRTKARQADPVRRDLLRIDRPAMDEALGDAGGARPFMSTRCASAPSRSIDEVANFIGDA